MKPTIDLHPILPLAFGSKATASSSMTILFQLDQRISKIAVGQKLVSELDTRLGSAKSSSALSWKILGLQRVSSLDLPCRWLQIRIPSRAQ